VQITILEKAKKARVGLSLAATFSLILSLFSSVAYAENLVARMSGHWSPNTRVLSTLKYLLTK